jgi:hypothetical protein
LEKEKKFIKIKYKIEENQIKIMEKFKNGIIFKDTTIIESQKKNENILTFEQVSQFYTKKEIKKPDEEEDEEEEEIIVFKTNDEKIILKILKKDKKLFFNETILKKFKNHELKSTPKLSDFEKFIHEIKSLSMTEYIKLIELVPNNILKVESIHPIFILNEVVFKIPTLRICHQSIYNEIETNNSFQTLFRSNSLPTKYLSLIFKLIGHDYLINNFSNFIKKICDEDLNSEVDSAVIKDPELVKKNIQNIENLFEELIEILNNSLKTFPLELIYILNKMKIESEKKYKGNFIH